MYIGWLRTNGQRLLWNDINQEYSPNHNFDIVNFEKSADRFDTYLDEKKIQLRGDKNNPEIISYGFSAYHVIQDYPFRGIRPIFMCANTNGSTSPLITADKSVIVPQRKI